jgi:hypothetical protein
LDLIDNNWNKKVGQIYLAFSLIGLWPFLINLNTLKRHRHTERLQKISRSTKIGQKPRQVANRHVQDGRRFFLIFQVFCWFHNIFLYFLKIPIKKVANHNKSP